MQKQWNKSKETILLSLWFISGLLFVFLLSAASKAQKSRVLTNILVEIDSTKGNRFIEEEDITELIKNLLPDGEWEIPAEQVNLHGIEQRLVNNAYIQRAEVYIDAQGVLTTHIKQNHPIIRVVNQQNISYYISEDGQKMPISAGYTARVPIASGYIADDDKNIGAINSTQVFEIYTVAKYINQNEVLSALIEQIYVKADGDMVLTPKLNHHQIILGDAKNIDQKFNHLLAFYKQALPNIGWSVYKTINLKFNNQIVCTKK
jgi:cell division protein FtsQ